MSDLGNVLNWIGRSGKRIAVTVVGGTLVVGGLVMLVFPGPGILVVIAGLAVLGTEYAWAKRALGETKKQAGRLRDRVRRKKK